MNKDLFLAILPMDSYNRGYGQIVKNLGVVIGQTSIGNAVISGQSDIRPSSKEVAAGFYALSCKIGDGMAGVMSFLGEG